VPKLPPALELVGIDTTSPHFAVAVGIHDDGTPMHDIWDADHWHR
jgi:hypothetical protein